MNERLLPYLACPECEGELDLHAEQHNGDEIVTGDLQCGTCSNRYPIRAGIPRFATVLEDVAQQTADAFGYEWTRHQEIANRYRRQFLDWIRPVEPDFFRDKVVLEGGCGKGRHTRLAAEFGARDVVAMDLSHAVDVAYQNVRDFPNAHVIQADIHKPPLKRVFDYAFSIGVLHHLPVPERGFKALVSRIKPGGWVSAWVYGREGNGWIVHLVSPVRTRVTARMPLGVLDRLSGLLTVPVYLSTKLLYGPTRGRLFGRQLPYGPYLAYISAFPFREQRHIVFDHLVAPVAHYISRDEFAGWFASLELEQPQVEWHNANSWRGLGRVPTQPPNR